MKLSRNARRACLAYTAEACVKAFQMHEQGEGASTIAQCHPSSLIKTTRQADAAINAGREIVASTEYQALNQTKQGS